jgi:hypothetical protein
MQFLQPTLPASIKTQRKAPVAMQLRDDAMFILKQRFGVARLVIKRALGKFIIGLAMRRTRVEDILRNPPLLERRFLTIPVDFILAPVWNRGWGFS